MGERGEHPDSDHPAVVVAAPSNGALRGLSKASALTAAQRSRTTETRLLAAVKRDEAAGIRDLTALIRDRTAAARDARAEAREAAAAGCETPTAEELLALAASDRRRAASERAVNAADREAAVEDRREASVDRREAGLDELTGVFRRATGEIALANEVHRSRRTLRPLVLVLIDVDGLKVVNDTRGHAAGDALLRDVSTAIAATLRSYDVTVRWGGDEFVCALSDVCLEVAWTRIADVQQTLDGIHPGASISAGPAQLGKRDTLQTLLARADVALYRAKSVRGG